MSAGIARIGVAAALLTTLLGLLYGPLPPLDIVNHFRPHMIVSLAVLALLAMRSGRRRAALLAVALALANLWWVVPPLLAGTAPASGASTLKIVSFNVWTHNRTIERVAEFLLAEDADVVLLQETPQKHRDALLPRLSARYPHVLTCNCKGQVLLAKRPWIETGSQPMSADAPPMLWARFADGRGGSYRVIGLHPAYPLKPWQQARHYDWLVREIPKLTGEPLILAGDFNSSPWGGRFQRLIAAGDLRRHGTWSRSWPAHLGLAGPQLVLIDNVLTTRDVKAVSFTTGPALGSDHLPAVARVALPMRSAGGIPDP